MTDLRPAENPGFMRKRAAESGSLERSPRHVCTAVRALFRFTRWTQKPLRTRAHGILCSASRARRRTLRKLVGAPAWAISEARPNTIPCAAPVPWDMWVSCGVVAFLRPAMWPSPIANAHFANLRDLNLLWFIGSPTPTCGGRHRARGCSHAVLRCPVKRVLAPTSEPAATSLTPSRATRRTPSHMGGSARFGASSLRAHLPVPASRSRSHEAVSAVYPEPGPPLRGHLL